MNFSGSGGSNRRSRSLSAKKTEESRRDTDLVDVNAQLEVQTLQIKILKQAIVEKEKEIEYEKSQCHIWKQKAFEKIEESNDGTTETIKKTPEYKELKKKYDAVRKNNMEITNTLENEREGVKMLREELEVARLETEQRIEEARKVVREEVGKEYEALLVELEHVRHMEDMIQKKTKELDTVKAERDVLFEELKRQKGSIEKLSEENAVLREHLLDMKEYVQQMSLRAEAIRVTVGRGKNESEFGGQVPGGEVAEFWKRMGLPEDEYCVQYYVAFNENLKPGWFYVTPRYVVFEASLKHVQTPNRCVIPIKEIVQIDKRRIFSTWIPGKGLSLMIRTMGGEEYIFRSFFRRKEAAKLIVHQAMSLGVTIITTREGKEANFFEAVDCNSSTPKPLRTEAESGIVIDGEASFILENENVEKTDTDGLAGSST